MAYLFIVKTTTYNQFVSKGNTLATSSSQFGTFKAQYAVDENFTQNIIYCSHTSNERNIKEAWLRINLRKVYSIKSVKFWYRTDRTDGKNTIRLPGYSILVSNESWPNSSCYRDPMSPNLPSINENECLATTQYIWFYQSHNSSEDRVPMLEICEVQVYGCDVGFYGENCSKTCGLCKSGTCDIVSGQCDELGCALPGLQASACIECEAGLYGPNCEASCSEYCKKNMCDGTSGTCLEGCMDGYTGDHCNDTCPHSKYGGNCSETCGNCFKNLTCNHVNGTCIKGCQNGFRGQFCRSTCTTGTFGKDCMQNCSGNCLDNLPCNRTNGMCSQCLPGWMNDFCTERVISRELLDEDGGPSLVVTVGPVIGLVVVIVSSIVFIVILRRRHNGSKRNREVSLQEICELDDDEDIELKESETENVYYNQTQICHKDIKILDIFASIQWLEKDSDKEFHKEFKSIPYGEQPDKLCTAGKLPENIPNNLSLRPFKNYFTVPGQITGLYQRKFHKEYVQNTGLYCVPRP